MKTILSTTLLVALVCGFLFVANAQADDELEIMHEQFTVFAKAKITHMDRSQNLSKTRMQVIKEGSQYRATYHVFDKTSLKCKVRRSRSKTIPFVGVMTFNVNVMEAIAMNPAAFESALFSPVEVKPNRHIYSFKQGAWQ